MQFSKWFWINFLLCPCLPAQPSQLYELWVSPTHDFATTTCWHVVAIQSPSHFHVFVTLWTAACQAPLSSTISWNLLKFMFSESVILSNHLLLPLTIPCHPLLLLPSIFPSIRVFSNESALCIGGQSIGASASVLPMNIQGLFLLGLTCLISTETRLEFRNIILV